VGIFEIEPDIGYIQAMAPKTKNDTLGIKLCGIEFANPVMAASGTFGFGDEIEDLSVVNSFGGIVLKALTLLPRQGNPPPRLVETPSGMLNSIGLQNPGVEIFLKEKAGFLKKITPRIIANIAGHSVDENVEIIRALDGVDRIEFYEINASCPNVREGGMALGSNPAVLARLVAETRKITKKKLIVKLTPNVTDIAEMAAICESEGADAISAINTLLGMAISVEKRKPLLANIVGGLSGPAIRPVGVRAVWQICSRVKIPVIGLGGIVNSRDCLEYMLAGATAVQIGTVNFIRTAVIKDILKGMKEYCKEDGIGNISEITGKARKNL